MKKFPVGQMGQAVQKVKVPQVVQDFRTFIARGNVVDLAVAVVIGAAFGSITTSLVNDIIMPPIGLIMGGVDFSNLGIVLSGDYPSTAAAVAAGAPVIRYGAFLNTVIYFLIVAASMFVVVQAMARLQRLRQREADVEEVAEDVPVDIALLTEIRDLLAAGQKPTDTPS